MIEMESALEVLAEDPSGYHLKQLREELFDMRTTVKRVMDAGMTADEMSVAKRNAPMRWPGVSMLRGMVSCTGEQHFVV